MKNKINDGILDSIGNTPMVKLNFGDFDFLAKLEYFNPGGSVKDRTALFMIKEAERQGLLKEGGTIVEASSGNQGIALAMIGAIKGYKVIITVPSRTSAEKVAAARAYGAQVIVCEDNTGNSDGKDYCSMAEKLEKEIPGAYRPNQYFNRSNAMAHYKTTGPEIWEQTDGKLTHLFLAAGSCGTIAGVGKYLKEQNKSIKIIGIDAATSPYSSKDPKPYENEGIGIEHPDAIFEEKYVDQVLPVADSEAFNRTRELALKGLLVGPSSGAVMEGVHKLSASFKSIDVVVALFADSGRAYLSKIFSEVAKPAKILSASKEKQFSPAVVSSV